MKKRPVVGVMGSANEEFTELAAPLGGLIASKGCHLLTGGGGGVMASVSKAYVESSSRSGVCLGIVKGEALLEHGSENPKRLYFPTPPNPWVEIPVYTHLPLSGAQGRDPFSRNHINVLSADILIALPGSEGTLSEVQLRIEYGKNVLLFLGEHTIAGKTAEQLADEYAHAGQVIVCTSLTEVERKLETSL